MREEGGTEMQHIMKEENLHESLVLHLTAVASMLPLAKVKDGPCMYVLVNS